jgi:PTH2 family peptidyl-tRNA hydrolase
MKTKQVIVLRKDLNMRKGKMCAQAAHASMAVLLEYLYARPRSNPLPEAMTEWLNGSFTKVCVSVNSLEELTKIYRDAEMRGLPCSLIKDAGLTEFGGVPTYTAVAVGPDYEDRVNEITGALPLL